MGWLFSKNKKQQEFNQLVEEHLGMFERIVASYEADMSLRQDLLQDVMLAVWQSMAAFAGDSSIKTYVARVALNRCITHVSKEAKRSETQLTDEHEKPGERLELQMSRQQKIEQLLIKIRDLKPLPRQVMVLTLEGFSQKEIAQSCNTSENNVAVIVNRCRKQLTGNLK